MSETHIVKIGNYYHFDNDPKIIALVTNLDGGMVEYQEMDGRKSQSELSWFNHFMIHIPGYNTELYKAINE